MTEIRYFLMLYVRSVRLIWRQITIFQKGSKCNMFRIHFSLWNGTTNLGLTVALFHPYLGSITARSMALYGARKNLGTNHQPMVA